MNFLKGKAVGWYISLAAMIAAIVSVIVYAVRGGDSTNLSPVDSTAVTMFVIGIVCNAIVLIKDFGIGGFVPFVFYTIVVGVLLNSEMLFLSNVLTSIDNNVLDGAWFVFIVTALLALLLSAVAAVMRMTKKEKASA